MEVDIRAVPTLRILDAGKQSIYDYSDPVKELDTEKLR